MFNIFKKKEKEQKNNLIVQWSDYCQDLNLTQDQILGLAYFNSVIPTVLANVKQDQTIITPLQNVISDVGNVSSEGANVLYLFKEIFYAASTNDNELIPLNLEGIPDDFFSQDENPYFEFSHSEYGFFKKSRVSVMLIQSIGEILEDYKISIPEAFQLGHSHMNFLLSTTSRLSVTTAVIMSNILPHYLAGIIEMIPNLQSLNYRKDLWIFSKVFYQTISDELEDDTLFCEWLWNFHNAIFYENKPSSTKVKSEWSLNDPYFEINMVKAIMINLPGYYSYNQKIGKQKKDVGSKFEKWEEFFPLLNSKMIKEYEIQSPTTTFINKGELCNYLAYKFIAAIQIIFEYGNYRSNK